MLGSWNFKFRPVWINHQKVALISEANTRNPTVTPNEIRPCAQQYTTMLNVTL